MNPRAAVVLGAVLWGAATTWAAAISAEDADGIKRVLDREGNVTVVVYSNPAVQERTRSAGGSLDRFQGMEGFRCYVVVDLRGTMADWAPGYTVRRMQRDLNAEAERITPYYRQNGNEGNPRRDVSAIADFKGEVCKKLGWEKPRNVLRVVVYGRDGGELHRWEDLHDFDELRSVVEKALEQ